MNRRFFHRLFHWRSLKTKVALTTLGIFLASLWSLSLYASRMLHEDMRRQLGEQEYATISTVASQIGHELETRLDAVKSSAAAAAEVMSATPNAVQAFLNRRPAMKVLFNGGFYIVDRHGVAVADFPATAERRGVDYGTDESIITALRDGKASISPPITSRTNLLPTIVMTAPIVDGDNRIIGALNAETQLWRSNFLDQITSGRYGKSGSYLVAAPQHARVVTATQKDLIMQPMSGPDESSETTETARFKDGFEGSTVFVNRDKVEVLAAVKQIPITGWYAMVSLPSDEAFAPIRRMQHRMLVATVLLSLLACVLTWWLLHYQMSPVLKTAERLARMADEDLPLHPLPIVRRDEIGRLISGFNHLLNTLKQRESLLKNILDTSSVAIFLVDSSGYIIQANRRMAEMFGRPLDTLVNDKYIDLIHPSEREASGQKLHLLLSSESYSVNLDRLYRRADGTGFWGHLTGQSLYDTDGKKLGFVGVIADIDERKKAETQLERMAHHDMLTGLANRALLADRLHQAMIHAQRRQRLLAVAYLDLDGFKAVNDTLGHAVGDQLLVDVARRMKAALRENDTLARLGGDEFVSVLQDLPDTDCSVDMIDRLLAAARQPVTIGDHVVQVSGSIGVTFFPQSENVDADQLLRQADQAMYQAKLAGKNRYQIFDADQDRIVRGHHESIQRIEDALIRNEFVLYFQPKVNMGTGKIIGAEALIRWQHPEQGLLPPAAFLPLIENHRISVDIGEWVIDAALTAQESWRAQGLHIPVSVNIGARQLQHPDFVDHLRDLLARHERTRPGELELEILETSALEDLPGISTVIRKCFDLGVRFALDDFGTGYSSLTYLKRLPVSTLKIDQSFVRGMLNDPDDLAILEGVVGFAAAFHQDIVAEGVETIEHGRMLLRLGCHIGQGYGIARPMPADDLPRWTATWQPDDAWRDITPIGTENFPLLASGIAHRVWMTSLERYLSGALPEPPPLSTDQCRCGQWFSGIVRQRYDTDAHFQHAEKLHREIHDAALDLCANRQDGAPAEEAMSGVKRLDELSNRLLAELEVLGGPLR